MDLDDEPSDWPLIEWQVIDSQLRCPICRDLFNTAMTLSPCNHTFCSICVRQSFTLHQTESIYKHCPTCRQQLTSVEKDLRNNRLIDELLKHYRLIRTKTIVALRDDVLIRRSGDIDRFAEVGTQTAAALDSNNDANESGGCLSGAYRNKSRPDREGFAQCPVCNRQVPIEQAEFNRHLDDCLTRQSQFVQQDDDNNNNNNSSKPPARLQMERTCRQRTAIKKHHDISSSDFDCDNRTNDNDEEDGEGDFTETSPFVTRTRLTNNLIGQQPKEQSGTARKPLKKPWFSGLSDSKLRQLLSGYGIPTYGSRKEREKRYMQFINIWNAACDGGDQRKTNRQLVQELMEWERTVGSGGAAAVSSSLLKRQRTANDSKADNGQHLTKYRDQFAELIATVKRQRCQTKENRNIT